MFGWQKQVLLLTEGERLGKADFFLCVYFNECFKKIRVVFTIIICTLAIDLNAWRATLFTIIYGSFNKWPIYPLECLPNK